MSFTRPYTQKELDFIRDNWERMTVQEIADKLGRSKSGIYKKISDMRLRGDRPGKAVPPMDAGPKKAPPMDKKVVRSGVESIGARKTDLERMKDLRDLIWRNLLDAEPSEVSKLAPEFRKTIEKIESMEGGDGADASNDRADGGLADIIGLVR